MNTKYLQVKRVVVALFVLLLCMAGTSNAIAQVNRSSKNAPLPAVQQKTVGRDATRSSRPSGMVGRHHTPQNRFDFGMGELDYTTYDWQSNKGAITRTIVWPDGKVNFAYTQAFDGSYSDRGTSIGTYDYATETWTPLGGRIESEKTGFGSIARYGQNGIVVAAHTASQCGVYIVQDKDNMSPYNVSAVSYLDPTYDPTWPNVMTSGANRDIIHVVATGYSDNTVYYYRSSDGGQSWDKQNVILPFMTSEYGFAWESNCCYWMETTDDNCLALVVNNPWSDGMVIFSYDDGETWERKVFWHHPGINSTFDGILFYPRWTSCQWDSNHKLHVLYEFNGTTGEPGSGSFYPGIGGVAYWNEDMPYRGYDLVADPTNPMPPVHGQPFIMDTAYLHQDIYSSWWLWSDATHEMWPEYVGYLPALDDGGNWEDPYNATGFNIEDRSLHGPYNSGVCAFPVLCMVPGTNAMVAVWSAMDENNVDENNNYYYRLFAALSEDGGMTWSNMVHLTNDFMLTYTEFVYNQAVVVDNTLIIASQADYATGTYVQSDDYDAYDNFYMGLTFDLEELFGYVPGTTGFRVIASANPSNAGTVTGSGRYEEGETCTLTATANEYATFVNWTKNGVVVSTNPTYSFTVTESATYVANFQLDTYEITATTDPVDAGVIFGVGTFQYGTYCGLEAQANEGYYFVNWTENGVVVSDYYYLDFWVDGPHSFVAHFTNSPGQYVSTEPSNRNVIIEDFTGRDCGYCPDGHRMANELAAANPNRVWPINIHGGGFSPTTYPNLNTDYGSTLNDAFNVSGYPMGVVNRTTDAISRNYWAEYTNEQLAMSADCNIAGAVEIDPVTRMATITVEVLYTNTNDNWENYLTIALLQDSILGSQADYGNYNPDQWIGDQYVHMHVLRDYVNYPYNYIYPSTQGSFYTYTYDYYIPETIGYPNGVEVDLNKIYFLAWVSESYSWPISRNVLNACKITPAPQHPYHWSVDYAQYETNMTVTGIIMLDGVEVRETNHYEIGAFYGDECRGREQLVYVPEFNRYAAFLTLYGEDGDQLNFRLYDYTNEEEMSVQCDETITFQANENLGLLTDPFVFHFNTANSYVVTAEANPAEGGEVSGAGTFFEGDECTLTAIPNTGYLFVSWTENGEVVSTEAEYTFTVNGNRELVANFRDANGYYWDVNIHTYPNNLIMVGVVLINGEEQATDMLEVGAFCNGECRGRERLSGQYYQIFGRYFVNLTVYGEDGDEISFRLYDHATETELDLTCAPITFTTNGVFGNPVNPHVLDFGPSAITQTTDFAEGWNWWSTYIDQTGIDGLTMLEEGLGDNGVTVKSQGDGFVQYMNYGGYTFWYGTLDHLVNSQTYMVQTDAAVQTEITGASVSPADSPITISEGWNWIGFPSANAMDFNTAFSGITPSNNDIVKTQNSFAQYMVYGSYSFWYGELSNSVITPGTGLMYKSENSGSYTFAYPTTGRATAPAATTAGKHWTNNVHAYPTNMTVLAVVELNDIELRSDSYELAAFANGECRGSAKLMYVEPLNRYMAFLTVSGNEAAELHFGLYDAETGEENYTSSDKLVYATDAAVGSYDEPMVVSFRSTTGLDVIERNLQVYPNPVERGERFSINLPVGSEVRVDVVNALGAFVSTETSTKAPASLLAPNTAGVYTLRITVEGEGTYCRKLVVR